MAKPLPSSAVVRCGTTQPDLPGEILSAGPLTVEFDNGALRYLRVHGVEVLRSLAFLVRDENWGTYVPKLSKLQINRAQPGFSITYDALCQREGQELQFSARIEGRPDGSLSFDCVARPAATFLTARTGFVVLHPLAGTAGHPLSVEHVDGSLEAAGFPALVDPVQPHRNIRALTHEALPGLTVTVRMEGDTFEMEDHRNWTDASFKTYVRPLALPWPYTLAAGEEVQQSVTLSLAGKAAKSKAPENVGAAIEVRLGKHLDEVLPPVGLGLPAEEIAPSLQRLHLLKLAHPRVLACRYDSARPEVLADLYGYRVLCEQTGAVPLLEILVRRVDGFHEELERAAAHVREAGLKPSALMLCPEGDLKSVLPGGERPPAPALEELYAAARTAFPGVRLGGGMLSFFTELNRKRPPASLLDFASNTTCPIVHAADDRSVMETLEALPFQVQTARSFLGQAAYRVGPSAIGCRDNPHGASFTPNPDNIRVCLARMDPRQRGLFGASWALGYLATLAYEGLESISLGASTGPLGYIYRPMDQDQPFYDTTPGAAVYPGFHVLSGVARGAGQKLRAVSSSAPGAVRALAYGTRKGTTLWLANLTATAQTVTLRGAPNGTAWMGVLDEATFLAATCRPVEFQQHRQVLENLDALQLGPYAVAFLSLDSAH